MPSVCDPCAVALRLTTDSGDRHLLKTPDGMTDREAAYELIRRTWLGANRWMETSGGVVDLDCVVRIEAVSDEPAIAYSS